MLSIRHQSSLTRVNHTVRQGIKMRLEVKRNNLVSAELKVHRPRIFHHDQVQVKRQLQSFPRSSELKVQSSKQIQVRRQLHSFPPPTSPSGEQGEVEALAHKDMAVRWIESSLSNPSSWFRPSPSSPSISTIVITSPPGGILPLVSSVGAKTTVCHEPPPLLRGEHSSLLMR